MPKVYRYITLVEDEKTETSEKKAMFFNTQAEARRAIKESGAKRGTKPEVLDVKGKAAFVALLNDPMGEVEDDAGGLL
jgi:hypothetical protein